MYQLSTSNLIFNQICRALSEKENKEKYLPCKASNSVYGKCDLNFTSVQFQQRDRAPVLSIH